VRVKAQVDDPRRQAQRMAKRLSERMDGAGGESVVPADPPFNAHDWADDFIQWAKANPTKALWEPQVANWFAGALRRGWDEGAKDASNRQSSFVVLNIPESRQTATIRKICAILKARMDKNGTTGYSGEPFSLEDEQ